MHNNYFFLNQLSSALDKKLTGFYVVSCFSQNKNELIIELNNKVTSFFIRALVSPSFSCLSFPSEYKRARKNSVDLFHQVLLKKVEGVVQFENERSFSIRIEKEIELLFKMHGNRSNIILIDHGKPINLFRSQLKPDLEVDANSLNRKIDWDKNYFTSNYDNLKGAYFTFGKETWEYLDSKGFSQVPPEQQWNLLVHTIKLLRDPTFHIVRNGDRVAFTLLPTEKVVKTFTDPILAVTEFFTFFLSNDVFTRERNRLDKQLHTALINCQNYIAKNQKKLEQLTDLTPYKLWADILMANLHAGVMGKKEIQLLDFTGNEVTIKLKPELSFQKNAELFYKKARNQEIEIRVLSDAIAQKQDERVRLKKKIEELQTVSGLKELRALLPETATQNNKSTEKKTPFHEFEAGGYTIWIGKNAVNNDLLTLKYAHKDDLWLHAKDVSGSHVIIRHQSGKKFPKDVIERAAELAAFNSKRKTETLCPVAYTHKKYVRKRKGDPPGAVVVEKETVILVEPRG